MKQAGAELGRSQLKLEFVCKFGFTRSSKKMGNKLGLNWAKLRSDWNWALL